MDNELTYRSTAALVGAEALRDVRVPLLGADQHRLSLSNPIAHALA